MPIFLVNITYIPKERKESTFKNVNIVFFIAPEISMNNPLNPPLFTPLRL